MKILKIRKEGSDQPYVEEVCSVLEKGGIVSFPTESFYALGVKAIDNRALERLFQIKKRPPHKPFPLLIGSKDILYDFLEDIPERALDLMNRFWPGPLTIVFKARPGISSLLTGGTSKIAFRIPGKGVALDIVRCLNYPVTATSANISTQPPAEDPEEVVRYFGDAIDLIIDGGRSPGGLPSTIVDVTVDPPLILRKGRVDISVD